MSSNLLRYLRSADFQARSFPIQDESDKFKHAYGPKIWNSDALCILQKHLVPIGAIICQFNRTGIWS